MQPRKTSVSRRSFIASSGIAALAAACTLSGCAPKHSKDTSSSQTSDSITWDAEADILVIGAGGAGLVAALTAARSGAHVIVLEASDSAGGNTSHSSGVIQAAGTPEQQSLAGISDDSPEKHAQYYLACGEGQLNEDIVHLACKRAPQCIEFMKELGLSYDVVYGNGPIPNVEAELQQPRIHLAGKDENDLQYGQAHVAALLKAAQDLDVEFIYGTRAVKLLQDTHQVVEGVLTENKKYYRGKQAVILATCSYDRNIDMARSFSHHMVQALNDNRALTVPTNIGDGIKMAMEIGADLDGMGGFIGLSNNIGGTPTLPHVPEVPGIIVNKYGHRFVSESDHYAWVVRALFNQEDHLAWGIFDSHAYALTGSVVGGVNPMSDDFSKEIADGTVIQASTIEELAVALNIPIDNLKKTIDQWNNDMTQLKSDSQFPSRRAGLIPIDTPPYFATRCYDYNLGALGGLKINNKTQVLHVSGQPIPHLYAAGQVVGGFMGSYYPGTGTGILSTLAFGQVAAEEALQEESL